MTINAPEGYESLARVLQEALDQAAAGKGKERHANEGEAFEDQQIVQLGEWLGSNHFQLGQAAKKLLESARLPPDRARREILGAINYAAAAVIQQDRLDARPIPAEVQARAAERVLTTVTDATVPGMHWTGLSDDGQAVPETPFVDRCVPRCGLPPGHVGTCIDGKRRK